MPTTSRRAFLAFALFLLAVQSSGQSTALQATVLRPAHVFDGDTVRENWIVLIRGEKIEAAGPAANVNVPAGARSIELPGLTLLPGLIEAIRLRARHSRCASRGQRTI